MSTLVVQVPESLHKHLQSVAESEGVSVDQFVSSSIAEKMSALLTERYLTERASCGTREKYLEALETVGDAPPDEQDEPYPDR